MGRPRREMPTQEFLRAILRYEPDTGRLFWRERPPEMFSGIGRRSWNARFAGKEAFLTSSGRGYLFGEINDTKYRAHRVIWKLVTGEEPDELDHINGDRADNRWDNLRNVSSAENARNRRLSSHNTSGVVGVRWYEPSGKWCSVIHVAGKARHLGYFEHKDDAIAARKLAERELGFHENHGSG